MSPGPDLTPTSAHGFGGPPEIEASDNRVPGRNYYPHSESVLGSCGRSESSVVRSGLSMQLGALKSEAEFVSLVDLSRVSSA